METKWIKTGKVHDFVFLGKNVIATACGNYVIFRDLSTKEERIEYFNSVSRNEGATCLAGHPMIPIFSIAEQRSRPKICIYTYPKITKIAECKTEKRTKTYLSCCFAGTELLLSLTSCPHFEIIVWLWRSGQKMASVDSNLKSDLQVIDASINSTHLVYQFAPILGKILLYEIHTYAKNVTIVKNDVKIFKNKISCVYWAQNNSLLLCDMLKNVFLVSSDGRTSELILQGNVNINGGNLIQVLPFYAGFVILDDKLKLTCYNKSYTENDTSVNWKVNWSMKCTSQPLKMTLARHKEAILLHCINGKVLELYTKSNSTPELEEVISDVPKFDIIILLRTNEKHCILANKLSNHLTILNILDGSINGEYTLSKEDKVTDIVVHPRMPLVAVCTSSGKCIFLIGQEKMTLLKIIYLQKESIEKIKFSISGCLLGAISLINNNFFLLNTSLKCDVGVLTYMRLKNTIVDFLIYDDRKEKVTLITLIKSFSKELIGNCVQVYSLVHSDKSWRKIHKIYMPSYYSNLTYGMENSLKFFALPYLRKQLHFFEIQDDFKSIKLNDVVFSDHKLRNYNIYTVEDYVLTSGYDGFVILRKTSNLSKTLSYHVVHHYKEKGARLSVMSVKHKMIVSLGKNGNIICLQLSDSEKFKFEIQSQEELTNFARVTKNYKDKLLERHDLTWLEQESLEEYEKMKNYIVRTKCLILGDLEKLKVKIKKLLDMNEIKSVECQLSISSFDLNKKRRQDKIIDNLHHQERKQIYFEETLIKKEETIKYLMEKFWNPLKIHDCTLSSFDKKVLVNNFSIYFEKCEKIYDFSNTLFNTPLNNSYVNDISDENQSTFEVLLCKSYVNEPLKKSNDFLNLHYCNDISLSGSISCKWIVDDFSQNQLVKIFSNDCHHNILADKEYRLKAHFNKEFEKMKNYKKLVLKDVSESINRLTHYKYELKHVFGIVLEDETYECIRRCSIESPTNLITITSKDNLTMSKLQENLSDHKHLSDISKKVIGTIKIKNYYDELHFRKEKLHDMMDSTLEIKWEDEVKKNVPKPDCLLFKNPSMYDDVDRKTLKAYNEKLKELQTLRIKYKSYLEFEIHNLNNKIEEDIQNFNINLKKFALKKINIQSSVLQEFLLRLRDQRNQCIKDYMKKKINSIKNNELELLEKENERLIEESYKVESVLGGLKSRYENLTKRDKIFEGKFKNEFSELKPPLIDHLLRQYKRRPRVNKIPFMSLTFLNETNKCLIAGKKSSILPQDYLDFLNGMDVLDVMPSSLPPQIDCNHWQLLCKLRRNKVEMEIKLRIAALELAETEQTFFHMQKLISFNQSNMLIIKNSIEEETLKLSRSLENPEIQLVLKTAQTEINTSGYSSDFVNATFVTCKRLSQINNNIINRGNQKVNFMRSLVLLKKSMLYENWKCQFMDMKLKHFKEHVSILNNIKISKNIRNYLIERLEKNICVKDVFSSEKMLTSMNMKFKKMQYTVESKLLKIKLEIENWCNANSKLNKEIESISSKKQEQIFALEKRNPLLKRNQEYHMIIIRLIMERTQLVENIKGSYNELMNLKAQLESLKLKTYPILHYNYCFSKR